MENNQPINKWKLATIILIVVTVILAAATLLFVIQSRAKQAELNKLKDQVSQHQQDDNSSAESSQNLDGYLDLKEWGLKFKIPEEFSKLVYEIGENTDIQRAKISGEFNLISDEVYKFPTYANSFGEFLRVPQNDSDQYEHCQHSACPIKIGTGDEYDYYFSPDIGLVGQNKYDEIVARYLLVKMASRVEFI